MKIDQSKFLASGMSLKKKAFTLIELLVVIAIIAILATVVIVNVTGARAKAQKTQAQNAMAVAAKVAAACATFGGEVIGYGGDDTEGSPVCNKDNIGDPTENASATGDYPSLPDGYSYAANAAGALPVVTAKDEATLTCTIKGCGSWSEASGAQANTGAVVVTASTQFGSPMQFVLELWTGPNQTGTKVGTTTVTASTANYTFTGLANGTYYATAKVGNSSGSTGAIVVANGATANAPSIQIIVH